MTTRKVHTAEFKRDAVQFVRTSNNVSSTGRDLGINVSLLRKWMMAERQHGQVVLPGHE